MSSFLLKLFREKRFLYSVKVFPASIKSIKPIQKYPHIIKSYACFLKIFVLMFLFSKAEVKRTINKCFNFFRNMFYNKRIEINNTIIIIITAYSYYYCCYYYYYFVYTKQPNEFHYQNTHQDLLYMPQPLFQSNCIQVDHL